MQLLRTMLHKKINPRNSPQPSSVKKYIEDRPALKAEKDDGKKEKICDDGSKWVRTDSECKSISFLWILNAVLICTLSGGMGID